MPMLNKSKTLTGTVPVCLWSWQKRTSPAGSYPAGPGRTLSVCCSGLFEPCSDTPPGPHFRINCHDTPLIPCDTPVTKKRHPRLLPRGRRGHINDLRHTRELRFASGYEAPVNSYLTGASPILFWCCARATGRWGTDSFVAPRETDARLRLMTAAPRCVSRLAPALVGGALPTLAQQGSYRSRRALVGESFVALRKAHARLLT
jgi:hypothetical protein